MNSGSLRYRVSIQSLDATQKNSTGQIKRVWVEICSVWADITFVNAKETIAGNREISVANVRIRIRWNKSVTPKMRVVYQDQIFDINDIMPEMKHRLYMDLLCTQGADDGGGA
jgi:SPP1 family predicted phage head-tail adaptor